MQNDSLHERAQLLAKTYLQTECDLVDVLQQIDQKGAYREKKCKSLFEYCIDILKLSVTTSSRLIAVARKSLEVPELKTKLQAQAISFSNASLIAGILTPENQSKWLEAAMTLPKRELEREIARENPKQLTKEKINYVTGERLQMTLGISEDLRQKLSRVQDLLSSRLDHHVNLEEALDQLTEYYLKNEDPLRKPLKDTTKTPNLNAPQIPARIRHQVFHRDKGQCTYKDPKTGKRCEDRRWLDIHHIKKRTVGGGHEIENLTLLCRGHHQMLHALEAS
jgi:5-methylcytosine-specific restriction endonuclease McrA